MQTPVTRLLSDIHSLPRRVSLTLPQALRLLSEQPPGQWTVARSRMGDGWRSWETYKLDGIPIIEKQMDRGARLPLLFDVRPLDLLS